MSLKMDEQAVAARNEAYLQYLNETSDHLPTPHPPPPLSGVRWTPAPPDIQDARSLFEYLSPEVRYFAVLMEAIFRQADSLRTIERVDRRGAPPEDWVPRVPESARPRRLYNRMIVEASRLLDALSHHGVTDQLFRPLAVDHPDRNERRVIDVLKEAVNVACQCLRIADACGAMGGRVIG